MGAVGTWEKLLGTFVTDAMITVAACITAVSGTFTVAAGVAQPEPSHETARRGRADSSAADEGKDGEEPQAHGAASTSRSARSPLLMSRASRRSSASPGRRALQRHAMSGRHGPYPLLTPSARSLTPVASIANGKATGWWGTTSLTMLTVLFAICVAASVTCDMLTFSSAATEQSSHPLVWIPYVVGDLFDDVSTCGCYIYLALVAWALRTRARRLLVAVQGGLEDEAYGVALTSTQLKQAQSDSNEALENYLGLHEAVEATSRRASLLPFVLIVVGVIENAAMVSALFQKSEDVDSTSHDEAPASVLVCMIRLYVPRLPVSASSASQQPHTIAAGTPSSLRSSSSSSLWPGNSPRWVRSSPSLRPDARLALLMSCARSARRSVAKPLRHASTNSSWNWRAGIGCRKRVGPNLWLCDPVVSNSAAKSLAQLPLH